MTEIPGGSFTLLGVFLMGLGLNLTPCVYPLISVTVSLFGGTREPDHKKAFLRAAVYVLGMATMYSSLGVAAAFTGELFGGLLQNRWVLVAIALILLGLSLSMFGVYTFQLPHWFLDKVGGRRKPSFIGIFLSGLFVGIFAAPCIGPPVIALLTFIGTRGDPLFAFWVFFVMSLGLGAPYLILGTFSGLLHYLPKAGAWLVWVERLFGAALVFLSIFYFSIAFGVHLFSPKQSVPWESFSSAKIEAAKAAAQPVIIDFYADWCIPCHELDQFTYSDTRVIEALNRFVKLKVDATNPDTTEVKSVMKQFVIIGVPTILFLDSRGEEVEEARVTGFIPPGELLEIIEKV